MKIVLKRSRLSSCICSREIKKGDETINAAGGVTSRCFLMAALSHAIAKRHLQPAADATRKSKIQVLMRLDVLDELSVAGAGALREPCGSRAGALREPPCGSLARTHLSPAEPSQSSAADSCNASRDLQRPCAARGFPPPSVFQGKVR